MAKSTLLLTHHIFLTKEQRYDLQIPNKLVTVMGISSPMWVCDGNWQSDIAHEVFCTYKLIFIPQQKDQNIAIHKYGYYITLTNNVPQKLKDFNDEGSECILLTHRNIINYNDNSLIVLHCLEIEDISHCKDTIT